MSPENETPQALWAACSTGEEYIQLPGRQLLHPVAAKRFVCVCVREREVLGAVGTNPSYS